MYTHGTSLLVRIDYRRTPASRDMVLNKWYEATYIEPYKEYTFHGSTKQCDQWPAVKLKDERGDDVILCLHTNRNSIEMKPKQENTMTPTTKQQALKELEELKARAKALEELISKPDVPEVYQGIYLVPKSSGDGIRQYYITASCSIDSSSGVSVNDVTHGTAYLDRPSADKALKLMELQQKYRIAAAADWGNEKPEWNHGARSKFVLQLYCNDVCVDSYVQTYYPYHFRTQAAAKAFLATISKQDARLLVMGLDA